MNIIAYPLNNVTYTAEDAMLMNLPISSGIYAGDSQFPISLTEGLGFTIGKGLAFMRYDNAEGFTLYSKEAVSFTLDSADTALPRIDRVVLQWQEAKNAVSLVVKKGTPSSTPSAPARSTTPREYELVLFDIRINANVTILTSSMVTDQRLNESLCGLMGLHNLKIDTAIFEAQIKDLINESEDLIQTKVDKALDSAKESGDFKGDPGYTPVKGEDYWTAEDQTAIVDSVLSNFTNVSEVAM